MIATVSRCSIETVPALMVALLEKAGDLPTIPKEFAVNERLFGFRRPSLDEGTALTWRLCWNGPRTSGFAFSRPCGVLGFKDEYDFHSASDVSNICYLAGSKRACVELLRHFVEDCRKRGRRAMGSIDTHNDAMLSILDKMGYQRTRITFEDRAA